MAKRLAILSYMFLFDPSDTGWTSGSKFEATLSDYWAAYGYQCDVVETAGSGVKAIMVQRIDGLSAVKEQKNQQSSFKKNPQEILKQMKPDAPVKSFKKFITSNSTNDKQPKLTYRPGGRQNATQVGDLPSVKFKEDY